MVVKEVEKHVVEVPKQETQPTIRQSRLIRSSGTRLHIVTGVVDRIPTLHGPIDGPGTLVPPREVRSRGQRVVMGWQRDGGGVGGYRDGEGEG